MATNTSSITTLCNSCENEEEEEDYINMELNSNILCFSKTSSPQNNKDFEFQMTSNHNEKECNTYPADELFYKGKLLPLNLLLSTTTTTTAAGAATFQEEEENYYKIIKCSTAPCTNTTNTPLDSCNISPSESCRVSCELNPDEYFFEWSTEFISTFINNNQTKKSWTSKKLKLIKKSSILGQKLKAFSRTYFKSLFFNKSHEKFQKSQESENDYMKLIAKKSSSSYPTIATIMENIDKEDNNNHNNNINVQRRSFSGAIKRHSPVKCLSSSSSAVSSSSSSSSSNSSSFSFNSKELYFFRRSSSAKEIEGSIEAAIAHCKKSGFCSLEDQKKQGV